MVQPMIQPHSPATTPPPDIYNYIYLGRKGCTGTRATRVTHTHTHVYGFTDNPIPKPPFIV